MKKKCWIWFFCQHLFTSFHRVCQLHLFQPLEQSGRAATFIPANIVNGVVNSHIVSSFDNILFDRWVNEQNSNFSQFKLVVLLQFTNANLHYANLLCYWRDTRLKIHAAFLNLTKSNNIWEIKELIDQEIFSFKIVP